ncbi:GNAT family N-acetyltransferase [Streptomyces sp. NPDC015492]|uniref:GNAT family N-acetyltransferase n=1 Tax=Streptomyces sp. NPDC015492 TaxID=3364958 RepID=UPI00370054FB
MELRPFTPEHAREVAGWPLYAEEGALWCGRREFPVAELTVAGWHRQSGVTAFLLVEGGKPLAYGELWCENESEVELARLIVAPESRGRGVGRELARRLLAQAVGDGADSVFLRVHPDNDRALKCWLSAGFVPVGSRLAAEWNTGQPVYYLWLRNAPSPPAAVDVGQNTSAA